MTRSRRSAWRLDFATIASAIAFLALVGSAFATTVSPAPQPPQTSGACPTPPLFPGVAGEYGSLVAIFQPGPYAGTTCALSNGGTLVGNELILGLYTPAPIPNASVAIEVKEFLTRTVTEYVPGPNNTTVAVPTTETYDVTYSNATISAAPLQAQQDLLTLPAVSQQENLTIVILGVALTVAIVVPGAGIPIPASYPELLLHDLTWVIYVVIFFAIGVGIATAIRLRARHVSKLWPYGVVGLFATIGFGSWFYADYPLSVIPLGSSPEAIVALPTVFAGMYIWLALFPTEAVLAKIDFPVAEVRHGDPLYDTEEFRVYEGPNGPEYIGPGGTGALLRLLGCRTMLDDRVLTQAPHRVYNARFHSKRSDICYRYYAWAALPGGPRPLEVVPPKVYLLPWRGQTREAIDGYHRKELKGRLDPPTHLGFFFYVTPSRAFAAVVGEQGATLVHGWISGTLHSSKIGLAFEKVLVAFTELKVSLKAQAIDYGQKIALALRMAEEFPDSKVALAALEDLATRQEAAFMDKNEWYESLLARVRDVDTRRLDLRPVPGTAERILQETRTVPASEGPRRDYRAGKR